MDATQLRAAIGPDEAMSAHVALQDALLGHFAAWVNTGQCAPAIADAASRLMIRFSENVLDYLLAAACRLPPDDGRAHWVRREFDEAMERFGLALRERIPAAHRHSVAQVLQLRMLEAEVRLGAAVLAMTATAESAARPGN